MAEYINRDSFLEQQRAWYCKDCNRRKNTKGKTVYEIGETPCRACHINDLLDEVENCPAAGVVEQKTGKWVDMGDFEQCSACKGTHLKEFESYYGKVMWIKTPYCPYCGAKMIGGDKDV